MISHLRIENYQSHALTDIELSPTVTVFTGESDQGKTAVLRALRKVLRNTPTGDFFIRWNQKVCRVQVTVNGVDVERVVGTKKTGLNTYTVGVDAYNNFGTSVPEEVRIALGIADVQVFEKDKIDFNIHTQHEGEFLVGKSGVESLRGRIFARITGSDVVNRAIAKKNSDLRAAKQEIVRQREQQVLFQSEVDALAYVEQLGTILVLAEQQLASSLLLVDKIDTLSYVGDALYDVESQIRVATEELDVRPELSAQPLDDLTRKVITLRAILNDLRATFARIKVLRAVETLPAIDVQEVDVHTGRVKELQRILLELRTTWSKISRLTVIEKQDVSLDIQPVQEAQKRVVSVKELGTAVAELDEYIQTAQRQSVVNERAAVVAEQEYAALRQELGVCPTCDRPFEEEGHE